MKELKEKIDVVCKTHNLGNLTSIESIKEGVLNENYVFETNKGKFFLKNFNDAFPTNRIVYMCMIEKFMEASGIPAVSAIAVDEKRRCAVYVFVESDRSHDYTQSDYYSMGEMLGRIHSVTFGVPLPDDLRQYKYVDKETSDSLKKIMYYAEFINNKESKDDVDLLFAEYIEKKLAYIKKQERVNTLSCDTLIHGDYHAGNLLIDKTTREIIGVCDWERSEYAPRAYDVARTYLYVGFGAGVDDADLCRRIGEEMLRGYRSVLALSDEEFKNGLKMRLKSYAYAFHLEDGYYLRHDARANKFLRNSIMILDNFESI